MMPMFRLTQTCIYHPADEGVYIGIRYRYARTHHNNYYQSQWRLSIDRYIYIIIE